MIKVIILIQNGQTGLRKVGTVVSINKKTAEHWIKSGFAKKVKAKKNVKPSK